MNELAECRELVPTSPEPCVARCNTYTPRPIRGEQPRAAAYYVEKASAVPDCDALTTRARGRGRRSGRFRDSEGQDGPRFLHDKSMGGRRHGIAGLCSLGSVCGRGLSRPSLNRKGQPASFIPAPCGTCRQILQKVARERGRLRRPVPEGIGRELQGPCRRRRGIGARAPICTL